MKTPVRFVVHLVAIALLATSLGCQDKDLRLVPEPKEDSPEYKQYGIPFAGMPATGDIVMYEVNLRALSPQANLQGVIDRLDHIAALGVNVIWLMPIHPIGLEKSVNSPYSVRNYLEVSSEFGTLDDLRKLTDQAHARGIAVLMDWVANHTAWDNPWIINKSWYTQDGSGTIVHPPGTNWLDVADLNYSNPEMQVAMIQAMQYWLYEANVDGFRCDYADGVPFNFWQTAWSTMDTIPGREFIFFAEGARNDHFNAGFDLSFGWQWYGAVKDVFSGQSVSKLFTANTNEYASAPAGRHWVRFTTNHDESAWDATPPILFNGLDGALAASVVTVFTGGVPLLYSSQEVGTSSNVPFFSNSTINWQANPEMLTAYQQIMSFYGQSDAARVGELSNFSNENIACFAKTKDDKTILVLVNVRNTELTFTIPAALRNTTWTSLTTLTELTLGEQILLAPFDYLILY